MFEGMLHRYKNLVNMSSEGRSSRHYQSVKSLRATTGTMFPNRLDDHYAAFKSAISALSAASSDPIASTEVAIVAFEAASFAIVF